MRSLIKKIINDKNVQSLSGNTIFAVLGFLSYVILTRSFSKEIFGEWVLYVTAAVFIEMLRYGLTKTALVRFLSGAAKDERKKLEGSNYIIGLVISTIIVLILVSCNMLFSDAIERSGYALFFKWYPFLTFINLPFNNAITILQAKQRFDKILLIKTLNIGAFVLFLALNHFFFQLGILSIVIAHLAVNLVASLICISLGWDGLHSIPHASKAHSLKILNFGKYATGTVIGSNLLQSADTFIIGLSPVLGPAGVALYSIPLKLTEILAIPLKSFSATAFPRMSKACIEKNPEETRRLFYLYSGTVSYLFLILGIVGFIFAEHFVILLGGEEYAETAVIFRIFCIYGLFLPIDRFSGVALDSLNKPSKNMRKVIYMTLANIAGDLIAIFAVKEFVPGISNLQILVLVAIVTIIMTIVGQIAGIKFLNRELPVNYLHIFKYGIRFFMLKPEYFKK
ncbi:MAG: lipopolysaccharide biosynthesis protein [Bacteroidota bacterium]